MNTTTRAALAVLAGFVVAAAANADPPPVFSDLSYEGAIAAAREQGRLLIVDGTAEWCGPCNQMDATTWVDPRVVEWLGKRAVAVQVDVDAEPDTAQALGINAMPTVIAFRDGAEIDRFVGYRAADDVLEWLNLVSEGRSMLDVLKERAVEAPGRPLREVIDARRRLVDHAGENERWIDAWESLRWLWVEASQRDDSWRSKRGAELYDLLYGLAISHGPARDTITQWREQSERALAAGEATTADLDDWLALSYALDAEEEIAGWVARVYTRDGADAALARLSIIGYEPFQILLDYGFLEDAGRIIKNPIARLQGLILQGSTSIDMMQSMYADEEGEDAAFYADYLDDMIMSTISEQTNFWAALAAAGRPEADEALGVLLALETHPALMRVALVESALWADTVSVRCLDWLDQAEQAGERVQSLRRRTLRRLKVMGVEVPEARAAPPPLPKAGDATEPAEVKPGY